MFVVLLIGIIQQLGTRARSHEIGHEIGAHQSLVLARRNIENPYSKAVEGKTQPLATVSLSLGKQSGHSLRSFFLVFLRTEKRSQYRSPKQQLVVLVDSIKLNGSC